MHGHKDKTSNSLALFTEKTYRDNGLCGFRFGFCFVFFKKETISIFVRFPLEIDLCEYLVEIFKILNNLM